MSANEAPRKDTGRKEFDIPPEVSVEDSRPYNHEAQARIEDRYEQFLAGNTDTPVVTEPIVPTESTEPRPPIMDTGQVLEQKTETQPIESESTSLPSFEPKYKTHEDAEKAYKEAERRMHEATQQASQYRKMVDEQNARLMTLLQQRQAPSPPAPALDPQEVEAHFYRDPLNFIGGLVNFAVNQNKADTLKEMEGRLSNAAKVNQIKRAEQESDDYFKSAHKELIPLEPFVKVELENMTKNPDYIQEVMNRHGNVISASKEIIDKAAESVRLRIPDLKKYFGADPGETRERLVSSPVVSPNAGATVVAPKSDAPETPQSYIASRFAQQDRITTGRIR